MADANPSHPPLAIQRAPLRALALLAVLAAIALLPGPARAESLVQNGALRDGEGNAPTAWRTDAWAAGPDIVYAWKHDGPGLGYLSIHNTKPNDSRWIQDVSVRPETWYRLAGQIRAIGVKGDGLGGTLSVMGGFDQTREIKGDDTGWQPVAMWYKTKPGQTSVTIACRLGGYGRVSGGEVWCTGIELTAQSGPPLNADFVFGPIEESTTPVGLPASLLLVVLVGVAIARYSRLPSSVPWNEALAHTVVALAVLVLKLAIAPRFAYKVDVGSYSAWALKLAAEGPARFYAPGYFADYPPGYMYVLWWVGLAARALRWSWDTPAFLALLKLPALLADLAITRLLFARLRPYGKRLAWLASLAFALNPALVINSAFWGQTDSVLALLALLAFFAQGAGRFELAWALGALAVLTKPQALLIVPLLAIWPWGWWKSGRPVSAALAALATVMVVVDPFRGDKPWSWLIDLYRGTAGYYAETSVNAMNLAALIGGMRHNDAETILGLSKQVWGFGIGGAIGLALFALYLFRRRDRVMQTVLLAWAPLVSFMCWTRMHERYVYPFFVFLGLLGVSGPFGVLYWAMSALFLANQAIVYVYQEPATAGPEWLWRSLALMTTLGFAGSLWLVARVARGLLEPPGAAALADDDRAYAAQVAARVAAVTPAAPAPSATGVRAKLDWTRAEIAALVVLTAIAGLLRVHNIGQPTDLVFDEIYFVEQARDYLKGTDFMDPHPPFAKLTIAAGIKLFGDNPSGWRAMNAVVGTALVPLMYLLARRLFRRRLAAFFAASFVSLDGLCIVDSRIAVIDIHYVTWAVATYAVLIELVSSGRFSDRWRLIAIGALIGLSLASKLYIPFFSFVLVLGTLALTARNAALRRGRGWLQATAVPVLIVGATASALYVLAFLPHFLWGWWHSPLDLVNYVLFKVPDYERAVKDATHPYSSKWWTWPLLLRPVWYYFKEPPASPGMVVGIWGAGNPSLWWAALPALVLAAWHAWRDRSLALAFVVGGWLIHFAPWIGIGRTLFLYHYLPSLLFAFLALAWMLDRLWEGEGSVVERGLIGAAVLTSLLPVAYFAMPMWGPVAFLGLLVGYEGLVFSGSTDAVRISRVAVGIFAIAIIAIAWYFMPIWIGTPLAKPAWQARMWISGSSYMNWI
jgi:Gpi18-like mannosyltransferase/4-amino-4-deoxy-L-arabinose transferase-like glycosyltransferase